MATIPIFILAGQSNASRSGVDAAIDQALAARGSSYEIVKVAHGGTALTQLSNQLDWNVHSGEYYAQLVDAVRQEVTQIEASGNIAKIAGFFWIQGEKDAAYNVSEMAYATALTDLVTHLRADLNSPNIPTIISALSTSQTQIADISKIVAAQYQVAASLHGVRIVDTDTLDTTRDGNIHYDVPSRALLGQWLVDALDPKVPAVIGYANRSTGGEQRGTAGDDAITASFGDDRIHAGRGDDTVHSGWGDNLVYGDDGNDLIVTDVGNDTIYGGSGDDAIRGFTAPIASYVNAVDDIIGYDDDYYDGGAGNDVIIDPYGRNTILGGEGNDRLVGGVHADSLDGGIGHDRIDGGAGRDRILGGTGNDSLSGGLGDDRLQGDAGNDIVGGDDGNDTISGGGGSDRINGGAGNDLMTANAGNDTVLGGAGNDRLYGDSGDDRISGEDGNDMIAAGNGNDLLNGGAGNDSLRGDLGNDRLSGGDGNDVIQGGGGDDTLTGGAGVDRFVFDGATDRPLGHDVITDFTLVDRLYLENLSWHGAEIAKGIDYHQLVSADLHGNAVISGDGFNIVLAGVAVAALEANNFLFLNG